MTDDAALTISGLHMSYGSTQVLRGIDLTTAPGSITAVLGPSGCGKTTVLRLIAGFLRPDHGTIRIGRRVVAGPGVHVPAERRGLGYVAQEGALFPHLTVAGNITFGLQRARRRDATAVRDLLRLVGLNDDLRDRYPDQLSGGQQQRVALARTLAPRPGLVLLDEPFSALDTSLRAETRAAVSSALSTAGVAAILVTHDQSEALSFADRIAVMHDGFLTQVGDPAEVYHWPADLRTAAFLGDVCTLRADVDDGDAVCALGRVPLRTSPGRVDAHRGRLMVRPEQLQVCAADDINGGTPGVISEVTYFGHQSIVAVTVSTSPSPVTVTCRTADAHLTPGTPVRIRVLGTGLLFPEPPPVEPAQSTGHPRPDEPADRNLGAGHGDRR